MRSNSLDGHYFSLITRLMRMNERDLQEMRKPFNREAFPKAVAIWECRKLLLANLLASYASGEMPSL